MEPLSPISAAFLEIISEGFEQPSDPMTWASKSEKISPKLDDHESDSDIHPTPAIHFHQLSKNHFSDTISRSPPPLPSRKFREPISLTPPPLPSREFREPISSNPPPLPSSKNRSYPKRRHYTHTSPRESSIPKCYCAKCCFENLAALHCLAVETTEGKFVPCRTKGCNRKRVEKEVKLGGVEKLVYDVYSGEVFDSSRESIDLSCRKKPIGLFWGPEK